MFSFYFLVNRKLSIQSFLSVLEFQCRKLLFYSVQLFIKNFCCSSTFGAGGEFCWNDKSNFAFSFSSDFNVDAISYMCFEKMIEKS